MNCSEEEIAGLAALVFDTRQRVISIPLAILSPNYSSSMARIAKSLPIAIKASPSRDQENNKRGAQEPEASPRTPPLVKEIKRNRSVSSTPQTPNTPAVKVVKFSASKPSPNVFVPREDVKETPRQRPTSALRELFNSPGASSAQFQRRPSSELMSIKVSAPEVDLPLSLVVPKDASILSVIVSILHKLDGSSVSAQLDSSGFELRMVDDDEPDMGLPALGANQQIGSFGCTFFALVKKAGATKSPNPASKPAPGLREDQSGASAPLPLQSEAHPPARQAEPRVATASCFHFDEFSASMYKEFDVVKVNRHGFRQLRKMGIDRDKIYNLAPKAVADGESAKKGAGLFGGLLSSKSGAVKKKSRLIREVRSIEPVEGQPMSISLVYNEKGGETSTYVFVTNSGEEAADIIARVRFLQRLHMKGH
ncbi:hypothetical protein KFL_000460210 [Klebsormidium nitens]|uniref:Uncharacterized protein n=1 Tax=Klebsormidium nitens TaxID=105231 RepID=A0A1Y1HN96_KLENI|nr:hypothetical protein KFL_000460210 [Klebsormidium nitens]|eukprot:GAQ80110.1 hypothetical protein KFL_000460210 [Klebsormidium nitens]